MTDTHTRTGVLLPLASLSLLGAGRQGAAAISFYGVATPSDFDEEFARLDERLQASDDEEAPTQQAISRAIVAAAHGAEAWASIRSASTGMAPAILLVGPRSTLAAVLHGPVVEYVVGDTDSAAEFVGAAVTAAGDSAMTISVFEGDVCVASARFAADSVDLAATDPDRLARLTECAGDGREALLAELVAVPSVSGRELS